MARPHAALIPGSVFPSISVSKVGSTGGPVPLVVDNGKPKMIVVYRGQFCPFCRNTLTILEQKYKAAVAAGFEVMAVSAELKDAAEGLVKELNLTFPVYYGLVEEQMRAMGTYISDPTNYIPQKHRFSEPATFVLKPDSTIKYMEIGSAPMMARINVDAILAGYNWSEQNAKDHPEFKSVVWGSVPNN